MAHTPGPWKFVKYATSDEDNAVFLKHGMKPVRMLQNDGSAPVMANNTRVCLVDLQSDAKRGERYKAECAERDANAHLIAAAPQMLEALEAIVDYADLSAEEFIAKYPDHPGPGNIIASFDWMMPRARAALRAAKGE